MARDDQGRFAPAGGVESGRIPVHPLREFALPKARAAVVRPDREAPESVGDGVAGAVARLQVLPDVEADAPPPEDDVWNGGMPNVVRSALNEFEHARRRRAALDTSWALPAGDDGVVRAWRRYREIALAESERLGVDIGEIPEDPPASEEGEEVES